MRGVCRSRERKNISKPGSKFENLFLFRTEVCFLATTAKTLKGEIRAEAKQQSPQPPSTLL